MTVTGTALIILPTQVAVGHACDRTWWWCWLKSIFHSTGYGKGGGGVAPQRGEVEANVRRVAGQTRVRAIRGGRPRRKVRLLVAEVVHSHVDVPAMHESRNVPETRERCNAWRSIVSIGVSIAYLSLAMLGGRRRLVPLVYSIFQYSLFNRILHVLSIPYPVFSIWFSVFSFSSFQTLTERRSRR